MSLDHALLTFDQRDANINNQKSSAIRDVESCLENNPNVQGHEAQFEFEFMVGGQEAPIVEEIEETGAPNRPR